MTEKKLLSLGKTSYYISQIFRWTIFVLIFTILGITTMGLGTLIMVLIFKTMQALIPFKTSVYTDLVDFTQQKIEIRTLKSQNIKKCRYNFIIFLVIIIPIIMILIVISIRSYPFIDILGVLVFPIIYLILILYQLYYSKVISDYIKIINSKNNTALIESSFIAQKPILSKDSGYLSYKMTMIICSMVALIVFLILGHNPDKNSSGYIVTESLARYILALLWGVISFIITYLLLNLNIAFDNKKVVVYKEKMESYFSPLLSRAKPLNHNEMVVVSIIVGTLFFLILGYTFGSTLYFDGMGRRRTELVSSGYSETKINYLLAIAGFIFSSGFTYLFLNRKNKK